MCYYESESKMFCETTITINNQHICWNYLDVTFTLCQARSHGNIQGRAVSLNSFVPTKFSCSQKSLFKRSLYHNNNKNLLPLAVYFVVETWL